ncbi:hypothetical protein [Saccharicrinis sp. FJH54]|uniref:hypothetical protein n=1 Tax=Saccharicrinis sp. FJH54 TaxID=3344665 RepID=UPI0035D51465
MNISEPIKLLWTGGWDSTFRLCELLILFKKSVQPYYLIDNNRKSLRNELQAQKKIKELLKTKQLGTEAVLLPTVFFNTDQLKQDADIDHHFNTLIQHVHYGIQYKWLAQYCKEQSITNLELSVEKSVGHPRYEYFKKNIKETIYQNFNTYATTVNSSNACFLEVFKYFQMPIFDKTKSDMKIIAMQNEFLNIMNESWFCHTPHQNKPCGICNPCKDAIHYGFEYRLNRRALFRYKFRHFTSNEIKKQLKHYISPKNKNG